MRLLTISSAVPKTFTFSMQLIFSLFFFFGGGGGGGGGDGTGGDGRGWEGRGYLSLYLFIYFQIQSWINLLKKYWLG